MTDRLPYTYTVLRYVHDTATAEFVTVGVVLNCPKSLFLGAKLRKTYGRLSKLFPDLDASAFKSSMNTIEKALNAAALNYSKDCLFPRAGDALAFARSIVPTDDSSLQWSPVGSGLTTNPEQQLEKLYLRLVANYDEKPERTRSDADVWRPVREKLDQAHLSSKLIEKTIHADADEIEFKHAWKNGIWHCYEALSFDLSDADHIKDKARRWMGHLSAVRDSREAFKPYFVVGAPADPKLRPAFKDALAILRKSPVATEIFQESETDQLVAQIEAEIEAHS